MSNDDPVMSDNVRLSEVIEVLRGYLDQRTSGQLAVNQRLDFVVSQLGNVAELSHRVSQHGEQIEQIEVIEKTMIGVMKDAQEDFDTRAQLILKDAELLRGTVREATLAFQTAQESQNSDWDDKWRALSLSIDALNERIKQMSATDASIAISRIGRTERIWIAVISVIGGALMALLTSIVLRSLQLQ